MVINIKKIKFLLLVVFLTAGGFHFHQLYNKNLENLTKEVVNENNIEITVLMYHFFSNYENRKGQYTIYSKDLKKDLEYINEKGYTTITASALISYVENGKVLPKNPLILTVDDSSKSFYTIMYPMLKEYNMKAILSVIGIYSESETNNGFHMNWEQLKEVEASGLVELQNHSYNLHDYGNGKYGIKKYSYENEETYKQRLKDDLLKNNEKLKSLNGITPLAFTYPLGYSNNIAKELIKEIGFKVSFSCAEKRLVLGTNLYDIPRFNRDGRFTTLEMFNNIYSS